MLRLCWLRTISMPRLGSGPGRPEKHWNEASDIDKECKVIQHLHGFQEDCDKEQVAVNPVVSSTEELVFCWPTFEGQ